MNILFREAMGYRFLPHDQILIPLCQLSSKLTSLTISFSRDAMWVCPQDMLALPRSLSSLTIYMIPDSTLSVDRVSFADDILSPHFVASMPRELKHLSLDLSTGSAIGDRDLGYGDPLSFEITSEFAKQLPPLLETIRLMNYFVPCTSFGSFPRQLKKLEIHVYMESFGVLSSQFQKLCLPSTLEYFVAHNSCFEVKDLSCFTLDPESYFDCFEIV